MPISGWVLYELIDRGLSRNGKAEILYEEVRHSRRLFKDEEDGLYYGQGETLETAVLFLNTISCGRFTGAARMEHGVPVEILEREQAAVRILMNSLERAEPSGKKASGNSTRKEAADEYRRYHNKGRY